MIGGRKILLNRLYHYRRVTRGPCRINNVLYFPVGTADIGINGIHCIIYDYDQLIFAIIPFFRFCLQTGFISYSSNENFLIRIPAVSGASI